MASHRIVQLLLCFVIGWTSSKPVRKSGDLESAFIDDLLSWRDLNVDPCENFYQYACGAKLNEPHVEGTPYFQNLMLTQDYDTLVKIKALMDNPSETAPPSFNKGKIAYDACMKLNPYQSRTSMLEKIQFLGGWPMVEGDAWVSPGNTLDSLFPSLVAMIKSRMTSGLFDVVVMPDPFNTARNLVQLFPSQSMMIPYAPELDQKIKVANSILAYLNVIYGKPQSNTEEAVDVVELSNTLWEIMPPMPEKIKDVYKVMTLFEAMDESKINFVGYLNELFKDIKTFTKDDDVVLVASPFFSKLGDILSKFTSRTIINFEMITTMFSSIPESGLSLGAIGRDGLFDLPAPSYELPRPEGSKPKRIIHPDWSKILKADLNNQNVACLQKVNGWFSYAIAKHYHDKYFTSKERQQAKETAREIIRVFTDRLEKLSWMDQSAREVAELKLKFLKETYLYGEWADNSELLEKLYQTFEASAIHLENYWAANAFMRNINFRLLGDFPIPKNASINFDISPMEVNAFYYPPENSITILEGIVQPQVFDKDRLQIFNYASLGTIIGHEITHGFDNNGQQYDEHGNLRDWMSEGVLATFLHKAECYVKQYDQYTLTDEDFPTIPGFQLKLDGRLTLGENIADNGGVQQAFWAYKQMNESTLKEHLPSALSEYSPEQVFFLTYAHLWCTKYYGLQSEINTLQMDVHSPGKFRVIGSLSNFDEFSKAFKCQEGSAMNRGAEACMLW